MSFTSTDRDYDPGIFNPSKPASPSRSRRPPTLLTGDDIRVAPPRPLSALFGVDGAATADPSAVAAKSEVADGRARFFVKVSMTGSDRGHLLDPRGMYYSPADLARQDVRGGRAKYEFKEVAEPTFLDYLQYLRRHDASFLRQAERAILNG